MQKCSIRKWPIKMELLRLKIAPSHNLSTLELSKGFASRGETWTDMAIPLTVPDVKSSALAGFIPTPIIVRSVGIASTPNGKLMMTPNGIKPRKSWASTPPAQAYLPNPWIQKSEALSSSIDSRTPIDPDLLSQDQVHFLNL
jgi:hypothetical protein